MKTKSAITGKFVSKKAAVAKPDTTFAVNDYPARMLRKLVRIWEGGNMYGYDDIIANIKKRMGWDIPRKPRKVK